MEYNNKKFSTTQNAQIPHEQIPNILTKVYKFGSEYTNTKHQTVCISEMRGQRGSEGSEGSEGREGREGVP